MAAMPRVLGQDDRHRLLHRQRRLQAVRALAAGDLPPELTDQERLAQRYAWQLSTQHRVDAELYATAEQAFGLKLPVEQGERAVIWRCDGGRVLGCFFGANVPCGQMDQRTELPNVTEWCEDHPGAGVPQEVTGHDTLWRWSCDGAKAMRGSAAWAVLS